MRQVELALPAESAAPIPFPHVELPDLLPAEIADETLTWLETDDLWRLRVEDFYEQHEFSLLVAPTPAPLAFLTSEPSLGRMKSWLAESFRVKEELTLVDVSAHRLTAGQTIRIHNDFLGDAETHRVLIQLNRGWSAERGGVLMLFASAEPETLVKALLPIHGHGLAFEISPRSHHAVSTVHGGARYTLVYTWRAAAAA